jgi:hypothetical protein
LDGRLIPSDKALRDYAFRVLSSEIDELRPGTTPAEVRFFVDQMSREQLTQLYYMMYCTGMVS